MTDHDENLWQTKLHARLHDPAEKALILMRKPEGHESGTVRELRSQVLGSPDVPEALDALLAQADHWSSAADRPQFPRLRGEQRYPAWTRTDFTKRPVLVHPLSGAELNIAKAAGRLNEVEVADIERLSAEHFASLIQRDGDAVDLHKTLLAFWRFGPELDGAHDALELGALWRLLPADTRTPDHTIWQHLDLASAFAGAGERPALLTIAFGPVQDFIAAGRSQSDLWAGSHFLSSIAWAGLKVLCEELGPDAVLFPQLRGIPVVDAWLAEQLGREAFAARGAQWLKKESDANPLFVAALPNKILALVPEARVRELADKVQAAMRAFVMDTGRAALRRVLSEVQEDPEDASLHCWSQLEKQLQGFPEVHWAAAPWSLIRQHADKTLDTDTLRELLRHFHGEAAGFLGSDAWEALGGAAGIDLGDGWFFKPNPGTLYPALFDLADQMLAATKSLRPFEQGAQEGWRCALAADVEWLTTHRGQLGLPPGSRKDTLWTRLAAERPSWVKEGEHLGALATIKRLWPTLFSEKVAEWVGSDKSRADRFVISSHTMALASSLRKLDSLSDFPTFLQDAEPAALPAKLVNDLRGNRAALDAAKRIPAYLDRARDSEQRDEMEREVKKLLGGSLERYYGLILMDGDEMGKWLSGGKTSTYNSIWHPQIRTAVQQKFSENAALKAYCESQRAVSPAYHTAISAALNDFAVGLARHLVEEVHTGKLLYAGGDDVMATVAVDELLPLMQALRAGYSGNAYENEGVEIKNGHAKVKGRLLRLMGEEATASIGAVIAHQMAPLAAVLRELRAAEKRAKTEGGRDAFSLTVIKRSGGALTLTAKWTQGEHQPAELLERLRRFLTEPKVSRRAVYNFTSHLHELPAGKAELLEALLHFQFERQSSKAICQHHDIAPLTKALAALYADDLDELFNFLSIAEFLARESRSGGNALTPRELELEGTAA